MDLADLIGGAKIVKVEVSPEDKIEN